ncbi:phosphoribosylglycinamide formyltransferase [Candidatus Peregrinibacteria bacterium]|nr:phosphoribosylglycinamide formyltransferase [Candidatus Peregrinibacteria bacterium]
MPHPFNIAVLASTKGTDLQAIIDEIKIGKLDVNLKIVISDKKNAYALERARNQGFQAIFINPKSKTREQFDREMLEILKKNEIDLIVLIGFMRILSPVFIKTYRNRVINVHPALIPKFSGPSFFGGNVHKAVIKSGDKETGCTFHFVTEKCDEGPIILQKKVAVEPNDTPETLKEKVQTLEKKWYPEVIRWIQEGKVRAKNKNMR